MTDKRIKFGCPFCGEESKNIQIKVPFEYKNYVELICPNCKVKFIRFSKQEVINKWNCRA